MKKTARITALILSALMLSSCSVQLGQVSDTSGIGRMDTDITSDTSDTIDAPDTTPLPPEPTASYSFDGTKYVYNIPTRDDSRRGEIYSLTSRHGGQFSDQPADWYFGKTSYDMATGEVTYVWDRAADCLDAVEEHGAIYRGDQTRKVCYLTFDCGYEYGATTLILDVLKEKQAPGLFFVTGHYVETEKALMQRMLDEGHIIGNHTVNHKKMTTLSVDEFVAEIDGLEKLYLEQFPDAEPLQYFRPPSGTSNEWLFELCDKMGYSTVMWSWTYYDYDVNNQPDPAEALEKVKGGLHPGCVYLLHAESMTNAAILGDLIDWIRSQGYEILPICDINYPVEAE